MLNLVAVVEPEILPPVDVGRLWEELTPYQQRAIGVAALVQTLGALGCNDCGDSYTAWAAAEIEGTILLEREVATHVVGEGRRVPFPSLAAINVRSCSSCGRTDNLRCDDGCAWVAPNRCSCCMPERP